MASDWALVEYRRGRYVKVTSDGTVLGKATDDEVKAWFAAHGWQFGQTVEPEPHSEPEPQEVPEGGADPSAADSGPIGDGSRVLDGPSAEQPALPAFEEVPRASAPPLPEMPSGADTPQESPELARARAEVSTPLLIEGQPEATDPQGSANQEPQSQAGDGGSVRGSQRDGQTHMPAPPVSDQATLKPEKARASVITEHEEPQGQDPQPDAEPSVRGDLAQGSLVERETPEVEGRGRSILAVLPVVSLPSTTEEPLGDAGFVMSEREATDRWLWVDPRQEGGYNPASFDVEAFLDRAIDLFRSKPWAGGKEPRRLAVNPTTIAATLEQAAEDHGLEIIADLRVTAGTYMLALAEREVES